MITKFAFEKENKMNSGSCSKMLLAVGLCIWAQLLEAWLALTRVKYHDNL